MDMDNMETDTLHNMDISERAKRYLAMHSKTVSREGNGGSLPEADGSVKDNMYTAINRMRTQALCSPNLNGTASSFLSETGSFF